MTITIDDCDILIPYSRQMMRWYLGLFALVLVCGVSVAAGGLLLFQEAVLKDIAAAAGGLSSLGGGAVPFRSLHSHKQDLTLLTQVRAALARGAVLSDFTLGQVRRILEGTRHE